MLMYEWGRNQPEFQTEKDSYRAQNYKSEEVIERLAFFRFSAKVCAITIVFKVMGIMNFHFYFDKRQSR